MNFAIRAAELSDEIITNRRYLHQHAELSFQEHETTAYLVSQLEKLGIPVQSFPDYTGCIATIQGGRPGRTVLLRADIDALPIQENSGVEFASLHQGVMHACGHDCHAAMLLGAAQLLWERREALSGTVKLLFQAAEEVF
ncbi:MAG: amidohydrolase, partial [Lawsonibacter sp.]